MADLFSTLTIQTLNKALDATALNQVLLTNNIANINTPGYKRSEVVFKEQLRQALNPESTPLVRSHLKHFPLSANVEQVEPPVVLDKETAMRWDGNNVDIEREMAKLSYNSFEYSAFSTLIRRAFDGLRKAMEGR